MSRRLIPPIIGVVLFAAALIAERHDRLHLADALLMAAYAAVAFELAL